MLSDIPGQLPLTAVLAEVDRARVDRIVLTGDIASDPMPVRTLERLLSLGDRVVWVRGNADRELYEPTGSPPDRIGPWAAAQLTRHCTIACGRLPLTATVDVDGLGPTLFCHAVPYDDEEVVLVDTRLQRWAEVLDGVAEQTIVVGHTHMPFVRLAHRRLIVNPGSIGMPYGRGGAHWAVLGPTVELRETAYDLDAAAAALTAGGYPDIEDWLDFFLRQTASDAKALRVFGPRDGRPPDR